MPELSSIVLGLAATLVALVALFVVGLLVLRFVRGQMRRRMDRRLARVEEILSRHGRERFANVDRLLFELGQVDDRDAVERALAEVLHEEGADLRPQLRQVYGTLGLTARYIRELRQASSWAQRASAAKALGLLAAVDSIPQLLEAMREEHEDDSVRQAAARALTQMQAEEAIPTLVRELGAADDWASPRLAELLVGFGERAHKPLLEALADEERVNARVWAAQILGRMEDRQATAALLLRLQDRSERVRLSVTEALGQLGDRAAVGELTRLALRDPVPTVRAEAARALGSIGDDSVLGELRLLLSADDYWTRLRAVEAIEKLAPEDTFPLEQALTDSSHLVRSEAARALERLGVMKRWIADLASRDNSVADLAERRLIQYGGAGTVESMLASADDPRLAVRARICGVFGAVGDPLGAEAIERLLKDAMWPVRVRAVEATGRIGGPGAADLLVPLLGDEEEMVRVAAVGALQRIGLTQLGGRLDSLRELYRHGNAEARCSVIDSIEELGEEDTADLVEEALGDPNAEVRLHALRLVGRRKTSRWNSRLIERLSDAELPVRISAARALSHAPDATAIDAMVECLTTTDRELRGILTEVLGKAGATTILEILARDEERSDNLGEPTPRDLALTIALGKSGDIAAQPHLLRMIQDSRAEIRAAAAEALGRLGPSSCGALVGLLDDPADRVRVAAIDSVGRIGSERNIADLVDAAQDPSIKVRARVAIALGRIGGAAALDGLCAMPDHGAATAVAFALTGSEQGRRIALRQLGETSSRQAIERLLVGEDAEVRERFRAALLLEPTAEGEELTPEALAVRYVHRLRNDREEPNRLDALRALLALDPPGVDGFLIEVLASDPAAAVRTEAVSGLAPLLKDQQVAAAVRRALSDPGPAVQRAAVEALGHNGDPANNDALLRCGALSSPFVADAIVAALALSNEGRVAEFTDELMGYANEQVQVIAARVLGTIGDAGGQRLLARFSVSTDIELRSAAIVALGRIGTMESLETIVASVGDPREEVRVAVAEALTILPLCSTGEPIAQLIQDPSLRVRKMLAERLGGIQDPLAVELLDRLAADAAEGVRAVALWCLLSLAAPEALDRYSASLAQQTEPVRVALRGRVAASGPPAGLNRLAREHRSADVRLQALGALDELRADLESIVPDAMADPDVDVRLLALQIAAREQLAGCLSQLESMLDDPDPRVREAVRRTRLRVIPAVGD